MIQFVQHVQEMPDVSCDAVKRCNEHDIKAVTPSIRHELVESRSLCFAPRNYVGVFMHDFASTLLRQFAEVEQLCLKMLVGCRNPAIERNFFLLIQDFPRLLRPFFIPGSSFRTRLMSRSVHSRTRTPPILCNFGADILLAAMYRWRLIRLMPNFS